jgi:protein-L-isoaspartate(D-aspartate) O-methyltransferase
MRKVPRHLFVPAGYQDQAYEDHPLPIGQGQTISQPYIVAVMSEAMELTGEEKVLEVGTGSGYQAAILSLLAKEVHTIEIVPELAERARKVLEAQGHDNVTVYTGDGYAGLPDEAPFDAVMITAAPPKVPAPLKQQLAVGGRLVLPVGTTFQSLIRIRRTSADAWKKEEVLSAVIFVPMTGKIQAE